MKITYFYAQGMEGIKRGPKLDNIEIDFSLSENIFNILLGNNGGGKTSLLSILHPLRDCYDGRKPVLDNKKAYKEIHIVNNEDTYMICHHWKPNKSFIDKNGKELNESGSIKEFNIIIKQELGIDGDFFKIGRLGSNVTNFPQLKSTDRKLYMSKYFPNIDDYLKAFNNVRSYYNDLNKRIVSISNEIEKFPEYDILDEKVKSYNKKIKSTNKTILKNEKHLTELETELKEVYKKLNEKSDENIKYNNLEDVEFDIKEIIEELEVIYEKIEYTKTLDILKDYDVEDLDEVNKCKTDIMNKLNKLDEERNTLKTKYTLIKGFIDNLEQEYESLNDKYEKIEDNKNKISSTEKEIEEIKDKINVLKENIKNYDIPKKIKNYISDLMEKKEKTEIIDNHIRYTQKEFNKLYNSIQNISNFINDNISEENIKYNEIKDFLKEVDIDNLNKELFKLNSDYEKLKKEENDILKKSHLIDILDEKPDNCNNKECIFIRDALHYKNELEPKLTKISKKLKKLEQDINDVTNNVDTYEEFFNIDNNFSKLIKIIKKFNDNIFLKEFIDETNFKDTNKFFEYIKSYSIDQLQDLLNLNDVEEYVLEIYNLEILEKQNLKNIEYLELLQEKEDDEDILKEIQNKRSKIKEYKNEISKIRKANDDIKSSKDSYKVIILELNRLIVHYEEFNEFENKKKLLEDFLNTNRKLFKKIDNYKTDIDVTKETIKALYDELETYETEYEENSEKRSHLKILIDNKNDLDNEFKITDITKQILDAKSGIPLELIDRSLLKFKYKANELLNIAYKGEYSIDFELTDKDFFINVNRNNVKLNDISMASQGETSLVTISISLSMLDRYNILYFDEIDSALSMKNKRMLFNILEIFIDELGIEQVFMITHNNEFLASQANLILFDMDEVENIDIDDEDFLANKEIVFDVRDFRENN